MGSETQLIAKLASGEEIVAALRERRTFRPGEAIRLAPDPDLVHVFDGATEQRL